jgi:hypothetical protein
MGKIFRRLSPRAIADRFREYNFYRRTRERLVKGYLRRTVALEDQSAAVSWQPLYYVLFKVAVVGSLIWWLYGLHSILGGWLESGFRFFKFHEIYNFTFPARSFFNRISAALCILVLGYYGLYFFFSQLQALFSSLAVSRYERKIYYVRSLLVKKDLHVFSIEEMDGMVLTHNLISRLFGIGTIVLKDRNGDRVTVRGLGRASEMVKEIAAARSSGMD